jgi:hypothetical protein
MTRFIHGALYQLLPVLLAIGCSGCGEEKRGGATVSGTVTLDGAEIDDGTVSFVPATGEGAPAGGKIAKGKYSVQGVATGKNRVHVDVKGGAKRTAREAMAERGKESTVRSPTAGAQGNDETIDVEPGSQTKDIQLQKAGGS